MSNSRIMVHIFALATKLTAKLSVQLQKPIKFLEHCCFRFHVPNISLILKYVLVCFWYCKLP